MLRASVALLCAPLIALGSGVRTSSNTFFQRDEDDVISRIEKRIQAITHIPASESLPSPPLPSPPLPSPPLPSPPLPCPALPCPPPPYGCCSLASHHPLPLPLRLMQATAKASRSLST